MKIDGDGDTYTAILMALADVPDYVDTVQVARHPPRGYEVGVAWGSQDRAVDVPAGTPAEEAMDLVRRRLVDTMPAPTLVPTDFTLLPPHPGVPRGMSSVKRRCPSCGRTDLFTEETSRAIRELDYSKPAICRCGWRGRERDLDHRYYPEPKP